MRNRPVGVFTASLFGALSMASIAVPIAAGEDNAFPASAWCSNAQNTQSGYGRVCIEVVNIVNMHLGVDRHKIVQSARFVEDLGADSLDAVELTMAFEEAFDINISDDEASKVLTVGEAIDMVVSKTANG